MNRPFAVLVAGMAIVLANPILPGGGALKDAWAGQATVTLSVPDMTCAACPITVGKSLRRVAGVVSADVSFEELTAVVTYDPDKTGVTELIEATTNVGYPSMVVEQ